MKELLIAMLMVFGACMTEDQLPTPSVNASASDLKDLSAQSASIAASCPEAYDGKGVPASAALQLIGSGGGGATTDSCRDTDQYGTVCCSQDGSCSCCCSAIRCYCRCEVPVGTIP